MLKKLTIFVAAVLLTSIATECALAGVSYALEDGGSPLIGEIRQRTLVYEDTFARIARAEGVGYEALARANPGVDPWLPGDGTAIVLPTQMLTPNTSREGIVVNLSELRLYLYGPDSASVSVYPIGIGTEGTATPLMVTEIVAKIEDPTWYPPDSVRARHASRGSILPRKIPPGVNNPLGSFAVQLARKGYFIHGTNQPIGVGRRSSSGCIRLYNNHIEMLVGQVVRGTPVTVVRQPYKVGWHRGALYLEAHPAVDVRNRSRSEFVRQIIRATRDQHADVDWELAYATARSTAGIPVRISR
jgi:L,D-transpeptidase ErfK/SrfK